MEVTGRIKVIGEVQTIGASGFRKRELVVETNEQYPQTIMIEFLQDNVSLLDSYQLESDVKVYINLRGRKWTNPEGVDKYFNSIVGWRIEAAQTVNPNMPQNPSQSVGAAPSGTTTVGNSSADDDSDLPF